MESFGKRCTGLEGLDEVIDYLRCGDNVVWQVDSVRDYRQFVAPFVQKALAEGQKIVYMRFADHEPIIIDHEQVDVYELDAFTGFESFSTQIHNIITKQGEGVYYIFDCLSDLLSAWATDLMIGNFFVITCPYLFELNTIAYFSILRNRHSFQTVARIRETTQLLLDIYSYDDNLYIHPLKVWNRYSPTMFLPHVQEADRFVPITNSVDTTRLFVSLPQKELSDATRHLDYWERLFLKASDLLQRVKEEEPAALAQQPEMVERLCRMLIGRDGRILKLAAKFLSLEDLLHIKDRLIGSGFIGGKAVGMLLARNILLRDERVDWEQNVEPHDSFYIGSDVFYTYMVQNGWWKLRMKQRTQEGYFRVAADLKDKMLKGIFPDEIQEQFQRMLEYFGQSPIIVRSSSLLEDGFGNAFAGKYESVFCVNQGPPSQRYIQFQEAVRKVFASTMDQDALTYRLQKGLEQRDEQMALLVQRVSGAYYQSYYFPYLAGVGFSHNTYVWKSEMNPQAGMLRLVFGLGTRAVERVEGDYPRVVALDAPLMRPHGSLEELRKFSQHDVDILDVEQNKLQTVSLYKLMGDKLGLKMDLIGIPDHETNKKIRQLGIKGQEAWILTFDKLLRNTPFADIMQKMLKTLEENYQYPVDIEFTVNMGKDGGLHINLLQCRPLQTKGQKKKVQIPQHVDEERIVFQSEGHFMGGSISQPIRRVIYVDPEKYSVLTVSKKYEIARLIGKLNRQIAYKHSMPTLLLGPGRWGTTTPSLGIPVTFSEISNVTVLGEIAFASAGLMPELSFGTHFFQDLVETDIFYVALFPEKDNVVFNKERVADASNLLDELLPEDSQFDEVVKVYDVGEGEMFILADMISQKVLCYYKD